MSKKPFSEKTSSSNEKSLNFERKTTKNGKPNEKYIDLLKEDPVISSQQYGCYSFVSPEKIIKQKDIYLFEKFVKQWDFTKSLSKFFDFLHFMAYKYNLKIDDLVSDFNDFAKEEEIKIKKSELSGINSIINPSLRST